MCTCMDDREIFNKMPGLKVIYNIYCCLVVSRNISEKQWIALGLITLAGCFNRSVMKNPPVNLTDVYYEGTNEGRKEGEGGGERK